MSTWRERLQEEAGPTVAWDWLVANYHYPSLALLLVFALYTRVVSWGNFRTQGTILYSGNDPFYHLRSVQYVVENFPGTMPFDPWTNFAQGTSTSQMGTLFDQLIATAALILGLGNPDDQLVRLVTLFAPAVFGTLTLVPAYLIGRRLGGRFGGVIGAAVVAFATGRLFVSGFVGTPDHHIAEALFQALGVLGIMVAVSVAQREKPVYELLAERSFGSMRQTLGWSLLGGTAVGVYLLVWPPGVLLLGILGVFFAVYLSTVFLHGRSPEHVAIAGAVAMVATAVITLSTINTLGVEATARSLLQPGLALAVAAGCGFMAWLARVWDERDIPRLAYPATVVGIGVAATGVVAVLLPSVYDFLANNVLRVVGLGLSRSQTAATVGEISPLPVGELQQFYKLAMVVAVAGFVVVLARQFIDDEPSAEESLVAVWFVFVVLATFTQQRFAYYLTIPVAGLVALFVGSIVTYVNRTSDSESVETHQIMAVGAIVLIVLVPMVAFAPTAMGSASAKGPGGGIQGWQPSLDYIESETPEPGTYANPGDEPMEYLGTYARTDDYDYPAGAYGVLSWWDYGHWITTNGERIPVANPFQQGANVAASFLLSQNETSAAAALAESEEPDAKTELVMVDWKMAETETAVGGKYFAPPEFVDGVQRSDYYSRIVDRQTLQQTGSLVQSTLMVRQKQPYYESMLTRLYHYHGSAAEPGPYVVEWQGQEQLLGSGGTFTFAGDNTEGPSPVIRRFRTLQDARDYVSEAPQVRQVGGIGTLPSERVPALEHYRLIHTSPISAFQSGAYQQAIGRTVQQTNLQQVLGSNVTRGQALNWLLDTTPSWTKTFERVPGATISGTGPADQTIRASVELDPNAGTSFTYTQETQTDEDGSFSLTVPYATTGDEEWGVPEGYANSSVTALGSYNVTTATTVTNGTATRWAGQVDVTEGQVLGEDDSPADVTLERESTELDISSGAEQDG
jgi:dolichyl-diphosphooligosaccharide--protein glycosyltransferase